MYICSKCNNLVFDDCDNIEKVCPLCAIGIVQKDGMALFDKEPEKEENDSPVAATYKQPSVQSNATKPANTSNTTIGIKSPSKAKLNCPFEMGPLSGDTVSFMCGPDDGFGGIDDIENDKIYAALEKIFSDFDIEVGACENVHFVEIPDGMTFVDVHKIVEARLLAAGACKI